MKRFILITLKVVFFLFFFGNFGFAKKVVCIDAGDDKFLNGVEGYVRSTLGPVDVIQKGGNLQDCLAMVANGDKLIIIAHGVSVNGTPGGAFEWGGTTYAGFGAGTGVGGLPSHPVPAGFGILMNVTLCVFMCWSALDPDDAGPSISVVHSLVNSLGNGASIGDDFTGVVQPVLCFRYPAGTTQEDADLASDCLKAFDSWAAFPPVNRSSPPPDPNQQTEAQKVIDQCPLLFHRLELKEITYKKPEEEAPFFATSLASGAQDSCSGPRCCESLVLVTISSTQVPTLTTYGLIILALLLAATAVWLVWKKRPMAKGGLA